MTAAEGPLEGPGDGPVGPFADLAAPATDPWEDLAVPPGWEEVAALAVEVAAELDDIAERIVASVVEALPEYRTTVPREDFRASAFRTVEMMLIGLAENRRPYPEEVAIRRELGHRRASQGLPVRHLIEAYHVGYRELWLALVRRLPTGRDDLAASLLTAATTAWSWVHETTDAIVAAHDETLRGLEAQVVGGRQRFTELLVTGDLEADEILRLAVSVGFDVHGQFRVAVGSGEVLDGTEGRRLQEALATTVGVHAAVVRGPKVVVVTQDAEGPVLLEVLTVTLPRLTFGVGVERDGLAGARQSLADAEHVLGVATPGTVARFEDEWLWATLLGSAPQLYEVLAPGADVAVEHPHLAETVLAFADAGFSVSETARSLELHANTVAYRLERWHALSGWDPRSLAGLMRSLAALRLSMDV